MEIKETIESLTPEMLEKLARLVKYNSERGEALPGKPFGEGPAAVLAEGLAIAKEMGFDTVNMDNYCGYAEMGEGKDIIAIAAHLDIVPAGEGWDTDPFTLTEKDGFVFGRGVSDDKGAVIASLYAMKLVKESGIPMSKRVRLLMGCAEETGSECMQHYVEKEGAPSCGFTPDGNFPGIHGEKGMMAMTAHSKNTKILSMNGGFVTNAVCSRCVTKIAAADVNPEALQEALGNSPLVNWFVSEEEGVLTIDATGVSAHASTPLLGVNAAGETMKALAAAGMQDDFVDFYNSRIGTACDGEGLGLKVSDEYGPLTLNNGIVKTENGEITCTLDLRCLATRPTDELRALCAPYLEDEKGFITIGSVVQPLFYPADSALVQNLYQAYVDVTGDMEHKPEVIGGGTYAKAVPGIIAFGCEFPDPDNHIHDANERLRIEELKQQVLIYVKAIENLLAADTL